MYSPSCSGPLYFSSNDLNLISARSDACFYPH